MKVKICGLRRVADVQSAVAAGADYIGFVFANSSRRVTLAEAQLLAKTLPKSVKTVGVFVNPTLAEVEEAIAAVPLDLVQLHGQESPAFMAQLALPIIKAITVKEGQALPDFSVYPDSTLFILDAPGTAYEGGSGQAFEWQRLKPTELPMNRILIAGGLTSENVADAIDYFRPYGVDVSSGVETNNQKDQTKIRQFIAKAKGEQ